MKKFEILVTQTIGDGQMAVERFWRQKLEILYGEKLGKIWSQEPLENKSFSMFLFCF